MFGPDRIVGPPGWLNTHYDIDAKVSEADLPRWKDPALQRTMFRTMLQAMLSERFKIAVHREYQDRPIFELTLAKGGPKLKPAEPTAIADFQQKHPAVQVHADIGGTVIAYAPDQMVFFNVTIPAFCANLSNHAGRPVNDKTGLIGKYDITLRTEPPPPPEEGATVDQSADFSSGLNQLGLKLESRKNLVEILIIDHIEMPSEN